jgi:hypothetical protein
MVHSQLQPQSTKLPCSLLRLSATCADPIDDDNDIAVE